MAEYDDYIKIKPGSPSKSASPAKKKAVAKKAPSKTVVTPGTKVSQSTINKIKSMGMSAALKSANSANPEMREGIRRLYGATRYNKAVSSAAPKPTDSRFSGVKKPDVKKPTDSRFSGVKKAAPKPTDSRFSGVKKATTVKKAAAPAQKTRPALGGFSMVAGGFKKQDTSSPAFKANQAKLKAAYDKAKAAKKSK